MFIAILSALIGVFGLLCSIILPITGNINPSVCVSAHIALIATSLVAIAFSVFIYWQGKKGNI